MNKKLLTIYETLYITCTQTETNLVKFFSKIRMLSLYRLIQQLENVFKFKLIIIHAIIVIGRFCLSRIIINQKIDINTKHCGINR